MNRSEKKWHAAFDKRWKQQEESEGIEHLQKMFELKNKGVVPNSVYEICKDLVMNGKNITELYPLSEIHNLYSMKNKAITEQEYEEILKGKFDGEMVRELKDNYYSFSIGLYDKQLFQNYKRMIIKGEHPKVLGLDINSGGILPIIKTLYDECSYKVESCVIKKNLVQVIMYHPTSSRKFEVLNRKKLIDVSKILWGEEENGWHCVVKDENGKKYRELIENCQ